MIAYTRNEDKTINILGGSNSVETLHKILPNKEFEVFDGEPFEFDGKYYLYEADVTAEQKRIKAIEDKRMQLISQYEIDKNKLMQYITEATAYGDEVEELREELNNLDIKFDEEIAKLQEM